MHGAAGVDPGALDTEAMCTPWWCQSGKPAKLAAPVHFALSEPLSLVGPTLIMLNWVMTVNDERIGIMAVAVAPWSTTTSFIGCGASYTHILQTCFNFRLEQARSKLQEIKECCPLKSRADEVLLALDSPVRASHQRGMIIHTLQSNGNNADDLLSRCGHRQSVQRQSSQCPPLLLRLST